MDAGHGGGTAAVGPWLLDPSGALVCGLERVLRFLPRLAPGKYMRVMGVIQACIPEPCLQAVKMTDLSDNPVHESMWALEIDIYYVQSAERFYKLYLI